MSESRNEDLAEKGIDELEEFEDALVRLTKIIKKSQKLSMDVPMCICENRDLIHNYRNGWNKCKNCHGWVSDEMLEEGF